CQPFSIAGFQKGFKDESSGNMFFEVLRFIKDLKPRAFLLENVKNLLSHDNGHTIKIIEEHLKKEGYFFKYKVLNSCEYGNIPQNRERIYIVGFKYIEDYNLFDFPNALKLDKSILDIINIKEKVNEKYYYTKNKCYEELKKNILNSDTIYQWRRVYVRENKSKLCPTLTANMGTGRT
ncbi:MAG: DNA (cytosine-5-)-methyltransferase, partial [Clostridia bacterium]